MQVEVEVRHRHRRGVACGGGRTLDAVEAHAVVPDGRSVGDDANLEECLDDREQPLEHPRQREVGLDLFLAVGITRLLQALAGVGHVPGLQVRQAELGRSEAAQLVQVALGVGARACSQVAQEADDFLRRARHLRHERQHGVARVAEEPGLLLSQREYFSHQRGVVAFGGPPLAGSCDVGAVHGLARGAVAQVLHRRQVARRVQRQAPAFDARCVGRGARGGFGIVGQPFELGFVQVQAPAVGRVEHVLRELLRQLGQARADLRVAFACSPLQSRAREHEVAHRMIERATSRLGHGVSALVQGLVAGEQAFIGGEPCVERGHRTELRVVGGAQVCRVSH